MILMRSTGSVSITKILPRILTSSKRVCLCVISQRPIIRVEVLIEYFDKPVRFLQDFHLRPIKICTNETQVGGVN